VVREKSLYAFSIFVCVMLDKEVDFLFTEISETLQGHWACLGYNLQLLLLIDVCVVVVKTPRES